MARLDPETVRLNRGPSREDLLENYNNLLTLMEDQDELRPRISYLTRQIDELNQSARMREPNGHAAVSRNGRTWLSDLLCGSSKKKDACREQEKQRVQQVLAQIQKLTPSYETVRSRFLAYETAIRELFLFLEVSNSNWQHKEAVLTMQEYIWAMRADTAQEAVMLYADECRHKAELRAVQAIYDRQSVHNRNMEMMRRLDEACLRMDAESARAAMERSAKKAHNAEVYADYKYHEMAGDIGDMDTYGWMKIMDLKL